MIKISEDRLKHSLSVARLMERKAKEKGWDDDKCREMFVLGYLHDFGYEYSEKQEEHPHIGGLLLKESGYKYWKEVYYHGEVDCEYRSDELELLNMCDMLINSKGELVTPEERLTDIKNRYGADSIQYKDASALVKQIKF